MLYDEDISEMSMIGLQNNGRGKAGVNRTETESVARETENDVQLTDTENDEQAADIEGGSARHGIPNLIAEREKAGLYTGQTFKDYKEFTEAVEDYEQKNFFYFTNRTSKPYTGTSLDKTRYPKKYEVKICQHGYNRKSRAKSDRPNQSYLYKQCQVQLTVSLLQSSEDETHAQYQITKFMDVHTNHTLNPQDFKLLSRSKRLTKQEQEKYVRDYYQNMEVPSRKVREVIEKETGKCLSSKDLINRKAEMDEKQTDIEQLLSSVKVLEKNDPHAFARICYSENQTVQVIFFQPSSCTKLFEKYGSVLMIDGTYNLTNRGFIVLTFAVIDNYSCTKLIAWAMLANEKAETLVAAMNLFKEANTEAIGKTDYIVIDKDYTEIQALFEVFPLIHWIICRWHCERAVVKHIRELHLGKNAQYLKDKFKKLFTKMIYEPTETEYFRLWDELCGMSDEKLDKADSLTVDNFKRYMEENWHNHRERWAFHILKHFSLKGTFTNNRSENINKIFKDFVKKQSSISKVVTKLAEFQVHQSKKRQERVWDTKNKTFLPTNITDMYEQEILIQGQKMVTKEAIKEVLSQYQLSKRVKKESVRLDSQQIECTRISGECFCFDNLGVPCAHLLFTRKHNKEDLLDSAMFKQDWLISLDQTPTSTPTKKGQLVQPMTGKQSRLKKRYMDSSETIKNVTRVLTSLPSNERKTVKRKIDCLTKSVDAGATPVIDDIGEETVKADTNETGNEIEIGLSPRRKVHLKTGGYNTGSKKSRVPIHTHTDKEPLEDYQVEVNKTMKLFGGHEWDRTDFAILECSTGFLTDNHFAWYVKLMKKQFPEIEGFNDTVLYTSRGYDSVSSDKVFIQPCHSGSIHWTLLTNINVQQEERGRKVCLYDSLVNFKYQSKVDCDVPPAIEWQAAQLIPKENCRNGKVIEILVTPCEQQQNGSDCGVFTMFNGIALANGYLPEELIYTSQNKRQELLSMFRQGHLSMPEFALRNSNRNFEYRFMRPVLARIQEMVLLPKIIHQVLLVCDCRMPENYDNVVCCDKCENIFHQSCYMMGASLRGNTIAAQLQCFLCYQCRKSGEYNFLEQSHLKPNVQAIKSVAAKIMKLPAFKIGKFVPRVKHLTQSKYFPSTLEQYYKVEQIIAKYDFNSVAHQQGELYAAKSQFYQNNVKNTIIKTSFHDFNRTQLVHLALLLVCECDQITCHPIYPFYMTPDDRRYRNSDQTEEDLELSLSYVIQANSKWVEKLAKHEKQISKRVKELCESGQNFQESRDERSELDNEMKKLQSFSQVLIDNLDKGVVDTNKVKLKEVKRKMLVTAIEVEENVEKSKQLLRAHEKKIAHTC